MRRLLFTAATLLANRTVCVAQVSTMGSTAMGLPSTPATIVTSPLNGPTPFLATTQPGTPDTQRATLPLPSEPTIPANYIAGSVPTGQFKTGTATAEVTAMRTSGSATGTKPT